MGFFVSECRLFHEQNRGFLDGSVDGFCGWCWCFSFLGRFFAILSQRWSYSVGVSLRQKKTEKHDSKQKLGISCPIILN